MNILIALGVLLAMFASIRVSTLAISNIAGKKSVSLYRVKYITKNGQPCTNSVFLHSIGDCTRF